MLNLPRVAVNVLGGLCVALFISGCVSIPQDLLGGIKDDRFYRRDMKISVDGVTADGVAVLPQKEKYTITIEARGTLDLFTMETCHRMVQREGEEGWFTDAGQKIEIDYVPTPGLEQGPFSCPIRLGGYEKKKGRHSWGLIEFEHSSMTGKASMKCDGVSRGFNGVGVCQGMVGTVQEIRFTAPQMTSKKRKCDGLTTQDGITFRLDLQKGECVYRFKEDSPAGHEFRLVTVGFEGILVRGD